MYLCVPQSQSGHCPNGGRSLCDMQAEACTEIGKLLHKKRDFRRAAKQLQKAVDLLPNSLQVLKYSCLSHRAAYKPLTWPHLSSRCINGSYWLSYRVILQWAQGQHMLH